MSYKSDGTIRVWSVTDGKQKFVVELGDGAGVESLSWSADGTQIAVVGKDKQLRIVDVRQQKILEQCEAHNGVKQVSRFFEQI